MSEFFSHLNDDTVGEKNHNSKYLKKIMKVLKCNSREMGVMEFLYCFKLLSFVQSQLLKKPAHDSLFMEKYARDREQLGANPLNRQVVK